MSYGFYSGKTNFGAIEIDWDAIPHSIKIEVRDVNGNPAMGVEFLLSELQPRTHKIYSRGETYQQHCTLESDLPWFLKYRLAFLFFGGITDTYHSLMSTFLFGNWKLNRHLVSLCHSSY